MGPQLLKLRKALGIQGRPQPGVVVHPGTLRMEKTMMNKVVSHIQHRDPVTIKVAHAWSKIMAPSMIVEKVSKKFSAFSRKAPFSPRYVANGGTWTGYVSAVSGRDGTFGTGLLPSVQSFLEMEGYTVQLDDLRGAAPVKQFDWTWVGHTLRPEQEEAVLAMKANPIGILKLPTGYGKTVTFLKTIQELGLPTLITVPTQELMIQTVKEAHNMIQGAKIGMLGAGTVCAEDDQIVVATLRTLMNIMNNASKADFIDWTARFEILIADECHKVVSTDSDTKTWKVIQTIPTYYRYGVSATPFEEKGTAAELFIRQAFGEIVYEKSMQEAKESGYVVGFNVMMVRPTYPSWYSMDELEGQDWREAHEVYIVNNEIRNECIVEIATSMVTEMNSKVLIVAQRIPHNDQLYQALKARLHTGIWGRGRPRVFQLHGKVKDREWVMETYLKCHEPCVLVASSIANDGLNIKDISCLIVAHGGKSFFQTVQRLGRGLRTFEGKDGLTVVDFDDSQLGTWFRRHAKERKRLYQELGGAIYYV